MISNNICSICLDVMNNNLYESSCAHIYHQKCIEKWFIESASITCPYCRRTINNVIHITSDDKMNYIYHYDTNTNSHNYLLYVNQINNINYTNRTEEVNDIDENLNNYVIGSTTEQNKSKICKLLILNIMNIIISISLCVILSIKFYDKVDTFQNIIEKSSLVFEMYKHNDYIFWMLNGNNI